ncbi:unnamed protein product [Musa hybrid cultivar]
MRFGMVYGATGGLVTIVYKPGLPVPSQVAEPCGLGEGLCFMVLRAEGTASDWLHRAAITTLS